MNIGEIICQLTQEEKMLLLTQGEKQSGYDRTYGVERLGIGQKYLFDGPHGVRGNVDQNCTLFPNLCCLAASWNKGAAYEMGEGLADECINQEIDMLLGPGVNLKRYMLCGRNFEYFSEDPVLSGELASGYINGLQSKGVGACIKHYALNNQELHREYESIEVEERVMREIYLKSFEIAIRKSSPYAVMCAYNKVDSIWCSENRMLLREILKDEWGYNGVVMSDWGAVHDVRRAIPAGLDMQMPRNANIIQQLKNGLEKGMLTESDIDSATERVLGFVTRPAPKVDVYDREKQHELARKVAAEGIVLLKNDGNTLPLNSEKYKKISFVGEYAVSPLICGQGSAEVYPDPSYVDSPYDETVKLLGSKVETKYIECYKKREYPSEMLWPKMKQFSLDIADSDAVVLFIGTMESEDTEKFDRRSGQLNPNFDLFIDKACAMKKKVIVVIQSGGAVILGSWRKKVSAIVQMWLGGEGAGGAVADVLTGKVAPTGKLPETFPLVERKDLEYPGDGLKIAYKEGFDVGYRYYDKYPEQICYPFGHGLSYTDFEYSDCSAEVNGGAVKVSFLLKNIGNTDGAEVVQIYIGKDISYVTRSEKELKAFEKIALKSGEIKRVEINIDLNDLAYYNRSLHDWVIEPGDYKVYVASSSRDIRAVECITVDCDPPYSTGTYAESMLGLI